MVIDNFPNEQSPQNHPQRAQFQVPVPYLSESTGLGDVIRRITEAFGVKPCGGCEQRQQALNRWAGFRPWDE